MKWQTIYYWVVVFAVAAGFFVGFVGGNMVSENTIGWQKWIGATSGWAAALAGFATILVLLHQIRRNAETVHRNETEAAAVFDRRISKLLSHLNDAWKHVEDIRNCADPGADIEALGKSMQSRIYKLKLNLTENEEDFRRLICKMHAIDASNREDLLINLALAVSPVYEHYIIREKGVPLDVEKYEADGAEYFEGVIFKFSFLYNEMNDSIPELASVFRERAIDYRDNDQDNAFRDMIWSVFPSNPENPY